VSLSIEEKIRRLERLLVEYGRVAVAFSGGVDSSFLLHCALRVLGAGNVLPLIGTGELVAGHDLEEARGWPESNGFAGVVIEPVDLRPLLWKEFVRNTEQRCYFCKLRMYQEFFARAHVRGFSTLLDGTNLDDLKDSRPGLQAIHELGVRTPLVEIGLSKIEIRQASRQAGLDTWDKPGGSCLATRIPHNRPISSELLQRIQYFESNLHRFGFNGCRVRLHEHDDITVYVQVMHDDLDRIIDPAIRLAVTRFFHRTGIKKIFLDLQGR